MSYEQASEQLRPKETPPAIQLAWQPSQRDYQQSTDTRNQANQANAALVDNGTLPHLQLNIHPDQPLAIAQAEISQKQNSNESPNLDSIAPSELSHDAQFGGDLGNWFRYLGRAAWHTLESGSQPKAADDLIFGNIVRAEHYYSEHNMQAVKDDLKRIATDVQHMTPEDKSNASAELALAFFFVGAKVPIEQEAAEQLGLNKLRPEELKALGIEHKSKLLFERDEFSIQAKVLGDDAAFFRATLPEPGVVNVDSIFKGSLSSGSDFLTEALKAHDAIPFKKLIFSGIKNEETIEAFKSGVPAAESKLGRSAARALESLGLQPKSMRYEIIRGKLSLVVDTQ